MGAFCVFGVSRSACRALAAKQQPTEIPGGGGRHYTPIEWGKLRDQLAVRLFETVTKVERISPEFDAPQFCRDWISVNPNEIRLAKIMVRGGKVGKDGEPLLRKGQQVFGWIEYLVEEAACEA